MIASRRICQMLLRLLVTLCQRELAWGLKRPGMVEFSTFFDNLVVVRVVSQPLGSALAETSELRFLHIALSESRRIIVIQSRRRLERL